MTDKERHDETTPVEMTFWDHLDVLRGTLFRMVVTVLLCSVVVFCFKEQLFAVILAPKNDDFIIYELLRRLNGWLALPTDEGFSVQLINTGLAEQFKMHVSTSLYVGFLLSSPYLIYLLFSFVSPGLYVNERKYSIRAIIVGYIMFLLGMTLCYFVIFPFTFRFLGTYQVSADVVNMITLQSYMETLLMMCFLMGVLFELPVLSWVLGRLGILSASFMKRYRRHAIVVILVISAVITPTSDVFTLCLVAFPICLLYELSIFLVKK